ncbi:hypothetical protein [Streptomyces sp. MUM 178J]|uniref:hypothetical protein n=1 Tax=Streptomyces sp. MUM 178J TaxID=2791991 RepID=UPI001F040C2A|nr:hypothetical protein [Streptomyces sp. MUM 178J]WRQ78012.1 hypothetical protein I3F59_000655 [Streptomyces sp. MUM 178J]
MTAEAGQDVPRRDVLDTALRWAGAVVGIAVNIPVSFHPDSDVDLLYAFPVFGLCVMAGVFAGDAVTAPKPGRLRTASVTPRRVRDFLPRPLTASIAAQAVILLLLLAFAVATATADADGRPGRALAVQCPAGDQLLSPWPGSSYAWPGLGGLVLGTAVCALLLRRITARPATDDQRRIRARTAIGAWGVLVTAPLFAVSLTMGVVALSLSCAGALKAVALWGLGATAFLAALTACHCLCVLLLPQAYTRARS